MYTCNCFLRHSHKDVTDKLHRLGGRMGSGFWHSDNRTILAAYPKIYTCYDDERDNDKRLLEDGFIDCGHNEKLFLALAALNDEYDDGQWFVYPKENHWFLCTDSNIEEVRNEPSTRMSCQAAWFYKSHKATVDELIEHFGKY